MTKLLALLAATLIASCGGGGSSSPTNNPTPPTTSTVTPVPVQTATWIRYQGLWVPSYFSSNAPLQPITLSLAPVAGQTSISSNGVARVEVRVGEAAPVVLTAPNSTDGSGRYLFQFDRSIPSACTSRFPTLPIAIRVVDVTGFEYTKNVASCPTSGSALDFGAFSDYGTTQAGFSYTATAPVTAVATRTSRGGYIDTLFANAQASFSASLPSADTDSLQIVVSSPGARVKARIDGGGGSFAESIGVGGAAPYLECCGPRASSPDRIAGTLYLRGSDTPSETYSYTLQIKEPATGAVLGTQTGTTYSFASIPFPVQRGQLIEVEITPNTRGANASAALALGPVSLGTSTAVSSNEVGTPARFKVYCCTP